MTTGQVWDYVNLLKITAELPDLTKPKWPEPGNFLLIAKEWAKTLLAAHKKELSEFQSLQTETELIWPM